MVIISSNKHGIGFYGLIIPWSAWGGALLGAAATGSASASRRMGGEGEPSDASLWVGIIGGGLGGYMLMEWLNN